MAKTLSLGKLRDAVRDLRAQVLEASIAEADVPSQQSALKMLDEIDTKLSTFCFKDGSGQSTLDFLQLK
jgi:hypothetical protein